MQICSALIMITFTITLISSANLPARNQELSAGLGALYISLSKFAELVFLYRHYPEDFSQVHSFGFGENNGNTQNESGLYSGLSVEPFKGLEVNAYFDQFKFPYRTYSNPASTSGNDFLTNVNYAFNKDLTLNFRYKSKNKEDTRTVQDESGRLVKKIDNRSQTNFRLGFDYDITDRFKLRSRYDYVFVKYDLFGGNNKGSLFFTDLRFNPAMGVSISTRFLFFETDSYDSRLYEYEEDIRGVMSNLGLYGKGRRWYVMVKFKPLSYVEISVNTPKPIWTEQNQSGRVTTLFRGIPIIKSTSGWRFYFSV